MLSEIDLKRQRLAEMKRERDMRRAKSSVLNISMLPDTVLTPPETTKMNASKPKGASLSLNCSISSVEIIPQCVQNSSLLYSKETQTSSNSPLTCEVGTLTMGEGSESQGMEDQPIIVPVPYCETEKDPAFLEFVERSVTRVERLLSAPSSRFLIDYAELPDENGIDEKMMEVSCAFTDSSMPEGSRAVVDMEWSSIHHELLLVSYSGKSNSSIGDSEGRVSIFSSQLLCRPEFVLECQSRVSKVKFHPQCPNLVVAGTYCGQIVLWDLRSGKLPIQKSIISSMAHSQPVTSLNFVGSSVSAELVSAGRDGKICNWQLNMLSRPQQVVRLGMDLPDYDDDNVIMSLQFPSNDGCEFLAGLENGGIVAGARNDCNPNIIVSKAWRGHAAPVTGIDAVRNSEFSPFLTSSMDWSIKLWSRETLTPNPILTFESCREYLYDVKWCPQSTCLFATADGAGAIGLYNLNRNRETRVSSLTLTKGALTKLAWNDRGQVVTGSSLGEIQLCSVSHDDFGKQLDSAMLLGQ